jgi:hypothetical protein
MTFKALKATLESRISTLDAANRAEYDYDRPFDAGMLEGRLAEAEVILDLINRVTEITDLGFFDDAPPWGKQERHDWPNSTFGAEDESEPGVARHDPERC